MINYIPVLKCFLNNDFESNNPFDGFNFLTYLNNKFANENNLCAICLNEPVQLAHPCSCDHIFCFACLKEWAKFKKSCPLCRKNFRKIKISKTQ